MIKKMLWLALPMLLVLTIMIGCDSDNGDNTEKDCKPLVERYLDSLVEGADGKGWSGLTILAPNTDGNRRVYATLHGHFGNEYRMTGLLRKGKCEWVDIPSFTWIN